MPLVKLTTEMQGALESWEQCNDFLRTATEDEAETLLHHELKTKHRLQHAIRIHSRFNKMRAARERRELAAKC